MWGIVPPLTSLWVAAGPQSNISSCSPSLSTWELPKRVGVGVGVPGAQGVDFSHFLTIVGLGCVLSLYCPGESRASLYERLYNPTKDVPTVKTAWSFNMTPGRFRLVSQVGRVPSMIVPLDAQQEIRFRRLMEESVMIDLHQHPMVIPEDFSQYWEYLRSDNYVWGYDAVREGGFTAVGTANVFRGMLHTNEMSFIRFSDLLEEISMMISDIGQHDHVIQVSTADEIEAAKQLDKVGFFPTVEHLAIGNELNRVDVLYNAGIRLAGLTYSRKAVHRGRYLRAQRRRTQRFRAGRWCNG